MAKKKSQKSSVNKGLQYEKSVAQRKKATHVGGPGKEDYKKGKTVGEVKRTKSKVTKPQLQELFKKGRTEVESFSGFTVPAIEYRNKYQKDKKLYQQGRLITEPKKKRKK